MSNATTQPHTGAEVHNSVDLRCPVCDGVLHVDDGYHDYSLIREFTDKHDRCHERRTVMVPACRGYEPLAVDVFRYGALDEGAFVNLVSVPPEDSGYKTGDLSMVRQDAADQLAYGLISAAASARRYEADVDDDMPDDETVNIGEPVDVRWSHDRRQPPDHVLQVQVTTSTDDSPGAVSRDPQASVFLCDLRKEYSLVDAMEADEAIALGRSLIEAGMRIYGYIESEGDA